MKKILLFASVFCALSSANAADNCNALNNHIVDKLVQLVSNLAMQRTETESIGKVMTQVAANRADLEASKGTVQANGAKLELLVTQQRQISADLENLLNAKTQNPLCK